MSFWKDKLAILQSVIAAMFGVQSQSKYQYDFSGSKFWPFVIAGLFFVLFFVASLLWFVNSVVLTA
ncbi:DUF2970 domain-containing protein [Pseudoalteromonas sp. T1lg65]|uniref:DUF2970 domain-containing protein n=1 Tax=Pseudoalteromonas sp. T1lg65 TaxID=2077101 RepID=UPI003F78D73E